MLTKSIVTATLLILFSSYLTNAQVQIGQDIQGEAEGDYFGWAVSMPSPNMLAVGARLNDSNGNNSGQVKVFQLIGGNWMQKGSSISGDTAEDEMGSSLSMIDSNTFAVGARYNNDNGLHAGQIKVYRWMGTDWVQKGFDIEGNPGEHLGTSVSMADSNTLAVGSPGGDTTIQSSGKVQVYKWEGSGWVQKGSDLHGDSINYRFGYSVSMPDSNTVAVGIPGSNKNGFFSGNVKVYTWNGSSWVQKGGDIPGEGQNDESGWSISMPNSNTIAVGAPGNSENGSYAGHVRVFEWNGSSWVQKGLSIEGDNSSHFSGFSVDMLNDNTLAIGAPLHNANGPHAGEVEIYQWNGNAWAPVRFGIQGEAPGEESGFSIHMADLNTIAVGAIGSDDNTGHVRVYSICESTAAYQITRCNSDYTVPSGDTTYTISGIYTDTLMNSSGCDSIITIDLTIGQVDTTVNVFSSALQANAQNATYQWLDCGNGFSEIANATNRAFVPNESGEYAVEVTQLNCSDTSQCYRINNVGLAESAHHLGVSLYPNPTKGEVNIQFEHPMGSVAISITNLHGQVIREEIISGFDHHAMQLPEQGGWYIIKVITAGTIHSRFKVLKL